MAICHAGFLRVRVSCVGFCLPCVIQANLSNVSVKETWRLPKYISIAPVHCAVCAAAAMRHLAAITAATCYRYSKERKCAEKGGNVTSAGWQVTLCDPIWHVSSRSGEASC